MCYRCQIFPILHIIRFHISVLNLDIKAILRRTVSHTEFILIKQHTSRSNIFLTKRKVQEFLTYRVRISCIYTQILFFTILVCPI